MNIVSFSTPGSSPRPGFLVGDAVLPADTVLGPGAPASVPDMLVAWDDIRERVMRATDNDGLPRIPRSDVRLHAPIRPGALILCAGGNYRSHLEEMGDSVPEKAPSFIKSPNAVTGPDAPIVLPPEFAEMVDFEGELCVVFGRECHRVSAHQAMDYVAGYTILNDVSARDGVRAFLTAATPIEGRWSVIEMLMGKQFPTFAPVGPAILTADEVPDPGALRLTTRLNGTVMQDAHITDLVVGIPQLVEEMSRYYSFAPGDLLSTGTPAGVGAGQKPPRYLRAGDEVAIEVTGIGTLTNRIVPAAVPVAN
ncbi:fumarylacetoacetate hydrolase family protein [Streptomyces justiciae]|uniref:fumarylacetoacetate hydrolase family protein n=1 Tax=Streptomyces justiciae TaxID=2780140 RepID=UPI00188255E5|nr:fumarylacetoacetate hydrolase family protein [Streptomyces justiciae]MBE8476469.1 fumarylacetoacetate hydrolase family protein [Streptomyces justiciae]